jgi:hypothetical protein
VCDCEAVDERVAEEDGEAVIVRLGLVTVIDPDLVGPEFVNVTLLEAAVMELLLVLVCDALSIVCEEVAEAVKLPVGVPLESVAVRLRDRVTVGL